MRADEIAIEAARRMADAGLNASERKARRAEFEAGVSAEAREAAETATTAHTASEAAAERARIAAVVKAGSASGRPRQALRLAMLGPMDATAAQAVLLTLQTDSSASPEALALPVVGSFGSEAAQAERSRIGAIFGHPEAEGRFPTAAALAFNTAVDPATCAVALAGVPQIRPHSGPSIEERVREAGDFGASFDGGRQSADDRASAIWRKATATAASRHPGATSEADARRLEADEQHSKNLRAEVDAHLATQMENAARIGGQRD